MKPKALIWLCLVGSIGAFGALGAWQHSRAVALRAERDRLIARQLERARAAAGRRGDAENELAGLRRQHDEWGRVRADLATVEQAIARAKGGAGAAPPRDSGGDELPPLRGPMVKSADWRNAGAATPEAALESFVWAATRGATDELGRLLAVDEAGRAKIADAFAQLSEEARATYGTPEGMLATLIAVQVPQDLSAIGAVNSLNLSNGDIALRTRTERGGAIAKDAVLVFRLTGGRWQLVVPSEIGMGAVAAAAKTASGRKR
ncbi:MAG: hypothetical protein HYV96_06800 [Opitutae bacterium]|nr:hypothetical protein [Opitutae bacterium]